MYAYENQLYNRVKTEGRTKYLKCSMVFNLTKPVHCPVSIKHDGTDGTVTGVRSAILATGWLGLFVIVVLAVLGLIHV